MNDKLESILNSVFPKCKISKELAYSLAQHLDAFDVTTNQRIASFLAQCGHESAGFSKFVENLNYSTEAIKRVFPKYFRDVNPEDYARNPEKLANRVYANRMGNGDEASGDGYKYRGRGLIQLTGRSNYAFAANMTGKPLLDDPDLAATDVDTMTVAALTYWNANSLSKFADNEDIKGQTKRINGGYNGLDERIQLYNIILRKLG